MDLEWTRRREAGVAFVACRLVNDASVPRRARVANRLDGPVLPPRRRGVPEAGWDADGVTVTVDADGTRAVGYACPAPVEESDGPPVELVSVERVDEAAVEGAEDEAIPAAAIRTLGDHRPPRAACDGRPAVGKSPGSVPGSGRGPSGGVDGNDGADTPRSGGDVDPPVTPAEPAAVEAWLDAVERRVERAERLDGADVATATEVFAATGGVRGAADLVARVEADADRLATVAERAEALAERAAATDPPTDALDRLA